MHKYRPVIRIMRQNHMEAARFTDPLLDFYTVTAYQNANVTELKNIYNQYAKGQRTRAQKSKNFSQIGKS